MNDIEDVYSHDIRRTGSPICEGLLFDAKLALGCHPKHLGDLPNLAARGPMSNSRSRPNIDSPSRFHRY
ncbi:hypothetical protein AWB69_08739 [Caballeronia udeis]|uniref:Uncharacterized protein n=1 Tax=Caballeronia udeis TaxID=1232866 RepID=A0A158JUE1_9BURK|nr:hypothetical protein AWB69_08739 [Caballeronia udeis]